MNAVYCKNTVTLAAACALLCCLLALHSCVNRTVTGGGADVGNPTASVRGRAAYENSNAAAAGASVYLRDVNYVRAIEDSARPVLVNARCDDSGSFSIDSIVPGDYFLEISTENGFAALARCTIVDSSTRIDLGRMAIKRTGAVRGAMPAELRGNSSWYAQIFGMDRIATVNQQTGIFEFPDLPEGTFTIRLKPTNAAVAPITIDTVMVRSGTETVVSSYPQWLFSKVLKLNTTATGADVNGTVTGFPVLIRLTTSNFYFSQAKSDGGDIRFTKSNGSPLPYEIERWDPVAGLAEVWVEVDTVFGNDSLQLITMYWGNPNASDNSNGPAVFDTSNGFQGVWHLNRKCDDVTYAQNNGTNYGPTDTTGIIGYCKKFDGSDSIKIAGLLGSPASITMSAWAQLDSVPGGGYGGEVLSIGDAILIRMDYSVLGLGTYGAIHPNGDSVYYNVSSGQFLKQTGWHFIAFSVDQNNHSQTLYIDGSAVRSENYMISIDYSRVGQNTLIGTHGNGRTGYNFSGMIDEVRVYRKSISADYLKLSFMNQRQDDRLVTVTSLSKVQ